VKVPKTNLVGTLNRGWDIAKYLLTHERDSIGGGLSIMGRRPLVETVRTAIGVDEQGRLADPAIRADVMMAEIDAWALQLTIERLRAEAKAGQGVGAKSALIKYYGTELNKRRFEIMMAAGGSDALEWEGGRSNDGALARDWLRTKANSIEGGTSEVMLNIIAKSILDLPGA